MTKRNRESSCANSALGPVPPPRALTKLEHVRAEMAKVYRSARTGKIEAQDATRLCYILVSLAKVIEGSALESRVEALEAETKE